MGAVLDKLFSKTTSWRFTSSAGANGGVLVVGAGAGRLYLKKDPNDDPNTLNFGGFGPSLGVLPGSFTFSTPDMYSDGIGQIRARTDGNLSFSDMQGPCVIVSGTASGMFGIPEGMSISIYFLNVSFMTGLTGVFLGYVPPATIALAATSAQAMGMMIGRAKGVDGSLTILTGWAH